MGLEHHHYQLRGRHAPCFDNTHHVLFSYTTFQTNYLWHLSLRSLYITSLLIWALDRKYKFVVESTLSSLLRCVCVCFFFFFTMLNVWPVNKATTEDNKNDRLRMTRVYIFTWNLITVGCLLLLCYFSWSLHVKHVEVLSNTTVIVASINTN